MVWFVYGNLGRVVTIGDWCPSIPGSLYVLSQLLLKRMMLGLGGEKALLQEWTKLYGMLMIP
jgi:hypothetical protein